MFRRYLSVCFFTALLLSETTHAYTQAWLPHQPIKQKEANQTSTNKSSSNAIGAGISLGAKETGINLNISASRGKGNSDGHDTTYNNTQINAGNKLTLKSRGDTNLIGATAKANNIKTDVGGDLTIQSLQDTSTYQSTQKNVGVSVAVPLAGTGGGSVNYNKSDINSTYKSVNQQSGLMAGDGGYDVDVKGDTTLTGGVIAASDKALADNNTSFKTGGKLTQTDLVNESAYSAKAVGVSASVGSTPSASGGVGSDSGHQQGVTRSGIGVSTASNTNGSIKPNFDAAKTTAEVNAQVQITQTFSQQAPKVVGDYATTKLNEALVLRQQADKETDPAKQTELKKQADGIESNWREGGTARVALHTAVGALSGGATGAAGAATTASAAPLLDQLQTQVQETLIAQGISPDKAKTLSQGLAEVTSAGMGAAVGGTQGAITGMAVDTNNRQLHQDESQALAQLKKGKSAREQHQLDAAACALAKCAEGVSANDPNYATLQALQQEGTQYTNAQKTLTSTGLFVYTNKDGVNDFLTKNGEIGTRLGGGLRMAGGAAGTVGGSAMAVVGVGTCPSVAGCALIPVGAGLAALSYSDLIGGSNQLTGPYNSTEGQRVLDSFSPSTYPGERDPSADLGIGGVTALVELGIGKYGFKLLDKMTVGDTVTPLPTKSGGVGKVSNSAQQENSPSGKYANRLDVQYRTAEDVNSDSLARLGVSGRPPYQTGTRVTEYVTKEADQFVRVTSGENAEGAWMMRKEAIQGLSPEEIARKYSLPATPKYISDVNVPAGTGIRTGKVESNFGGNQGAIQYELISRIPRESFTNTRPLR